MRTKIVDIESVNSTLSKEFPYHYFEKINTEKSIPEKIILEKDIFFTRGFSLERIFIKLEVLKKGKSVRIKEL